MVIVVAIGMKIRVKMIEMDELIRKGGGWLD